MRRETKHAQTTNGTIRLTRSASRAIASTTVPFAWTPDTNRRANTTCTLSTRTIYSNRRPSKKKINLSKINNLIASKFFCLLRSAFENLIHNRTLITSRHAFLGTNQFGAKYLGDYDLDWDNYKRFVVASVEMSLFGYSMVLFLTIFYT